MTHLCLDVAGWEELKRKVPLGEAGTFVFEARTGDLWSFLPAPLLGTLFAAVAIAPAREIAVSEIESDLVLRAKFSWLGPEHFEKKLGVFGGRGAWVEKVIRGYPWMR